MKAEEEQPINQDYKNKNDKNKEEYIKGKTKDWTDKELSHLIEYIKKSDKEKL
jgi:hypothetical protein